MTKSLNALIPNLVKLNHLIPTHVDQRILDLGFKDCSYNGDEMGSVSNSDDSIMIYCPCSRYNYYSVISTIKNETLFEGSNDVVKVVAFLKSL